MRIEDAAVPRSLERHLTGLLNGPVEVTPVSHNPGIDFEVRFGPYRFLVELKGTGDLPAVHHAIEHLKRAATSAPGAIPLLVAPFLLPAGRARCSAAGVSWADLSGNARIEAPGLRVVIDGQPNRYVARGRPSNAFAPKSSRVVHWLLTSPSTGLRQRDIASSTGLDAGYVSRTVSRLVASGLLAREKGRVTVPDRKLLVDAWREAYRFSAHDVVRCHSHARSGEELAERVGAALEPIARHAFTGLAAAWQLTHFAAYRLVTVYVDAPVSTDLLDRLEAREEPRGANLWLVRPADSGVFIGQPNAGGLQCVSAVQAWLDLEDQPERAQEAAEALLPHVLGTARA